MERDFLGVVGRNFRDFAVEESAGSRLDSVGSVVHRPFQKKTYALQKSMSFEASGEEKRKKMLFEPLFSIRSKPTTSIDAFQANNTACTIKAPEKLLNMEDQGFTQFSISQKQATDTHRASTRRHKDASFAAMSHSTIPIAMISPFLKSHGSSNGPNSKSTLVKQPPFGSTIPISNPSLVPNGVGSFTPRIAPKPPAKNDQLTIFYAGSVIVFDDVPFHLAQAILFMASKKCKTTGHTRSETSVQPLSKMVSDDMNVTTTQTLNNTTNHVQNLCSQPQLADDGSGTKSVGDLILMSKSEHTKTISTCTGVASSATTMPGALPQARKASLARFLEKRKERINCMMPYSSEKRSSDGSIVLEGVVSSTKSSSADASISSIKCGSW